MEKRNRFTTLFILISMATVSFIGSANAVTITTSGTWNNATTVGLNPSVSGEGTNLLSWGVQAPLTSYGQSFWEFTSISSGLDIGNDLDGLEFTVGGFRHKNSSLDQAAGWITSADLSFTLNVLGDTSQDFLFDFIHNETPTTLDEANIPQPQSGTITIGGLLYEFSLIGFRENILSPVSDSEFTEEQTTSFFQLVGRFDLLGTPPDGGDNGNPPAPVPEPSTFLLLGSGLAGLVWFGRKRKKA